MPPLSNHACPPKQPCMPPQEQPHRPPQEQPCMPPPVIRMTNWCKNITLPQTSFAGGNKWKWGCVLFGVNPGYPSCHLSLSEFPSQTTYSRNQHDLSIFTFQICTKTKFLTLTNDNISKCLMIELWSTKDSWKYSEENSIPVGCVPTATVTSSTPCGGPYPAPGYPIPSWIP